MTSTIKNPLTVIAIFAGLAEVAGTVVLPFVADTNQLTYIWFLMLFPTLLVILFFLTLNWNPKVLYAPSDFQDESHYMEIFRPSSATEKLAKLEQEIQEEANKENSNSNVNVKNSQINTGNRNSIDSPKSKVTFLQNLSNDPRGRHMLAENLIIDKLAAEFGSFPKREMALRGKHGGDFLFDAIFEVMNGPIIVEIKYISDKYYMKNIKNTLQKINDAILNLPVHMMHNAKVLLAFAHEQPSEKVNELQAELIEILGHYNFNIEYRFYNLKDLIAQIEMR